MGRLGLGVGVKTSLVTDSENEIVLTAPYSLAAAVQSSLDGGGYGTINTRRYRSGEAIRYHLDGTVASAKVIS